MVGGECQREQRGGGDMENSHPWQNILVWVGADHVYLLMADFVPILHKCMNA